MKLPACRTFGAPGLLLLVIGLSATPLLAQRASATLPSSISDVRRMPTGIARGAIAKSRIDFDRQAASARRLAIAQLGTRELQANSMLLEVPAEQRAAARVAFEFERMDADLDALAIYIAGGEDAVFGPRNRDFLIPVMVDGRVTSAMTARMDPFGGLVTTQYGDSEWAQALATLRERRIAADHASGGTYKAIGILECHFFGYTGTDGTLWLIPTHACDDLKMPGGQAPQPMTDSLALAEALRQLRPLAIEELRYVRDLRRPARE